jgi:hypothetical protein
MKTTFLVLSLLMTSAAFAQFAGSMNSQPQPYHAPENPAHASIHALASERWVLSGTNYTSAQGEKPAWELPQAATIPLGDVARTLRDEHSKVKKARFVYEN